MKYKYIIPVICLLALFASTSHALRPGDAAPDILGRLTTGKKFKLSNYSGKIRVVNFFTMNCPPCKKELPELALLENKFPEVQIIAIHLGALSIEKVVRFLSGLSGHPDKIVISSMKVKKTYGIRGFPYSVVIDSNNRVYKIIPGYNTNYITSAIKELTRK
jgi:thiol-disulfide isomerase/thioredoxin